ncbi:MAG: TonB family protein [Elusimicrobia bacterium]|nr:TonB family protein [Elusimicrobiota bacterium]
MEARLPVSVITSFALHAGGLAGYLLISQASRTVDTRFIDNVDLIMAAPQMPRPAAPKPLQPPSLKDFLKLALPAIPKPPAPSAPLEVKAPEIARKLMDINQPKLDDRGKLKRSETLEGLDLGHRRESLAKIDLGALREAKAPIDALPKLEEVGVRRASKKAVEMAALADERSREAPQALAALPSPALRSSKALSAAPLLAPEAPRGEGGGSSRIAQALAAREEQPPALQPRALPAIPKQGAIERSAIAPRRQAEGLQAAPKKGVEIEGPLRDRQVVASSIPPFPQWAKDQGLVEADVAIRFYVDFSGRVLENIRVEKTSGFGRLDRLVIEHLKAWRFAPVDPSAGNQWGVITFRFVAE